MQLCLIQGSLALNELQQRAKSARSPRCITGRLQAHCSTPRVRLSSMPRVYFWPSVESPKSVICLVGNGRPVVKTHQRVMNILSRNDARLAKVQSQGLKYYAIFTSARTASEIFWIFWLRCRYNFLGARARACCTLLNWGRQRRLGRWVGGWFGWKPSRPCVRQIRARRRPSAASNGWLADAHHRAYMHQVFMISSKKCFDPAVRFWSVCLFKFLFSKWAHAHTERIYNHRHTSIFGL